MTYTIVDEIQSQRIIEYSELEGTCKDHGVQLLVLHRITPKIHFFPPKGKKTSLPMVQF